MSSYLPTACFTSALSVLSNLHGEPAESPGSSSAPIAIASQVLRTSAPSSSAAAAVTTHTVSMNVDQSDEIEVLSTNLESAKRKVTTLKTKLSSANAGILKFEEQIEHLKAQLALAKKEVSEFTKQIEMEEPRIKLREDLLVALGAPLKQTHAEKRKISSDRPEGIECTAGFPNGELNEEKSAKKSRTQGPSYPMNLTPIRPFNAPTSPKKSAIQSNAPNSAAAAISSPSANTQMAQESLSSLAHFLAHSLVAVSPNIHAGVPLATVSIAGNQAKSIVNAAETTSASASSHPSGSAPAALGASSASKHLLAAAGLPKPTAILNVVGSTASVPVGSNAAVGALAALTPPAPISSSQVQAFTLTNPPAASVASTSMTIQPGGHTHSNIDEVLSEVFVPGTIVLYKTEDATIKRYVSEKKEFIIAQNGKEFSVSRKEIVYFPKAGQKVLMREQQKNDSLGRLYEAEVISVEKAVSGSHYRSNSINIKVKWLGFDSVNSESINYRTLDKLLLINPENPIMSKLKFTWVAASKGAFGKGYFLSY